MWFDLSLAFGIPVQELMSRMTALEFNMWRVFTGPTVHGPIGERRADWRAASICHSIACTVPSEKQPPSTDDFLLAFQEAEEQPEGPRTLEEYAEAQKNMLMKFCKRW